MLKFFSFFLLLTLLTACGGEKKSETGKKSTAVKKNNPNEIVWKKFTSSEGAFTVNSPGLTSEIKNEKSAGKNKIKKMVSTVFFSAGLNAFSIQYYSLSEEELKVPPLMFLGKVAMGITDKLKAKISHQKTIKNGTLRGISFHLKKHAEEKKLALFLGKKNIFIITTTIDQKDPSIVDKFIDSFRTGKDH
ncbi:MAG: hypothetical protein JXR95_10655 [Deltaproteobacteria bacterium]|nr:hypothetical protein [Deltaproteobacteria bacterium]